MTITTGPVFRAHADTTPPTVTSVDLFGTRTPNKVERLAARLILAHWMIAGNSKVANAYSWAKTKQGQIKRLRNDLQTIWKDPSRYEAMKKGVEALMATMTLDVDKSQPKGTSKPRFPDLEMALKDLLSSHGNADGRGPIYTVGDLDKALQARKLIAAPAPAPSHSRGLKAVPDADFRILGDPARPREERSAALERLRTVLRNEIVVSGAGAGTAFSADAEPELALLDAVFNPLHDFINRAPAGSVPPERFWRRVAAHSRFVVVVAGQAGPTAVVDTRGNEHIAISPAFSAKLRDPARRRAAAATLATDVQRLAMSAAQQAHVDVLAATTTADNAPAREARRRAVGRWLMERTGSMAGRGQKRTLHFSARLTGIQKSPWARIFGAVCQRVVLFLTSESPRTASRTTDGGKSSRPGLSSITTICGCVANRFRQVMTVPIRFGTPPTPPPEILS